MLNSSINIDDQINLSLSDRCKTNDEIIFIGFPKNFKNLESLFFSGKPIKIFSYKNFDLDELLSNIKVENEDKIEFFKEFIALKDEDKYFYEYNDERKNGIFNLLNKDGKKNNLKLLSKEQKKFFSLSTIFKKYNLEKKKILLIIFDENLIDKKLLENIDIEFIKTIIYWSDKYILDINYYVNEFHNNNIKICYLDEHRIYNNKLNLLRKESKNNNSKYMELKDLNENLVEKIESKNHEFLELQNSFNQLNNRVVHLDEMNHLNFSSLKLVFPYKRFIELNKEEDINFKDKENILNLFKSNIMKYQNHLSNESINNYYLKLYSYSLFKLLSFSNKELSNIFTKQVNKNKLGSKRKFVKVIGTAKSLKLNKEHNFAKKFTLYNFSNSSLCTFIPKNACTSLRFSFALSNGFVRGIEDINWIHSNNDSQKVSEKELINCSYTFVVLRSPFTRLSSYFLDKIVGNSQDVAKEDESYKKTILDSNFDPENLTFEKFVNIMWENPKLIYKDIHTIPQIEFLLFNDYDKWVALENLSKELNEVEENSGIKFFDTRKSVNNTTYRGEINNTKYFGDINIKSLRDLKSKKIFPSHQMLYSPETAYKCLHLYISDIFLYIEKTKSINELKSFLDLGQKYIENN